MPYSFNESAITEQLTRGVLFVPNETITLMAQRRFVYAAVAECATAGLLINPQRIYWLSTQQLTTLIHASQMVCGAHRMRDPLYPNFPYDVEDDPTERPFIRQLLHCLSGGTITPHYDPTEAALPQVKEIISAGTPITVYTDPTLVEGVIVEKVRTELPMTESDYFYLHTALEFVCDHRNAVTALVDITTQVESAPVPENLALYLVAATALVSRWGNKEKSINNFVKQLMKKVTHADTAIRILFATYYTTPGKINVLYTAQKISYVKKLLHAVVTATKGPRSSRLLDIYPDVQQAIVNRIDDTFTLDDLNRDRRAWKTILKRLQLNDLTITDEAQKIIDALI